MGKKHKKHHKSEKRSHEEKPLKLVLLKVSGQDRDLDFSHEKKYIETPLYENPTKEHHHKSSKKKKKKKSHDRHRHHDKKEKSSRKREREVEMEEYLIEEPPAPLPKATFILPKPERRLQPSRICRGKEKDPEKPLKKLLENLQRQLQRKDPNQFFAWPVTDMIAPGYSGIIQQPMDFSTMQHKIDHGEYDCVDDYKNDLRVMCQNAMTYNREDTVYYKAAKKLLNYGFKVMSKERLNPLKRAAGFDEEDLELTFKVKKHKKEEIVTEDSTVDIDTVENGEYELKPKKSKSTKTIKLDNEEEEVVTPMEGVEEVEERKEDAEEEFDDDEDDDSITAEEIIEQATYAAQYAKEKLSRRCPNSKIGFLRREKDGTTTLAVVNPDHGTETGEEVHPVNLGALVGKLTAGSSSIAGFREDKRNKVNPVSYLMYGPFGSYAPSYDSSFATISKEDSDLLLTTYQDETGMQYAKSLQSFVRDSGDYAMTLATGLLDRLTDGEHSKTMKKIQEKHEEEEKKIKDEEKKKSTDSSEDKENDKDKADIGSDTSKQSEKVSIKEEPSSKESTCQESKTTSGSSTDGYKESVQVKEEQQQSTLEPVPEIDFEALKSLSDIGIDMSFLPAMEKEISTKEESSGADNVKLQDKLNEAGDMIKDLEKTQNERMSKKPPSNLQYNPGPSDKECEIAEKLTQQLKELTSQAGPGGVVSTQAVHNAMGITVPDNPAADLDIQNILVSPSHTPSHMSMEEDEIDRELREFLESPSTSTEAKD
ncbi:bromodomain-containing protein 7-like [Glandiceps talaboti]